MSWQSMHGNWRAEDGPIDDLWLKLFIVAVWPGIPILLLWWALS